VKDMAEQIYIDDLECPHCDWDCLNDSWDIEVDQHRKKVTSVVCENCGREFYVHAELSISLTKEK
jgi:transcription elongation factor Elf1